MVIPKHYSPPPIPDATPPTLRVLQHLLESDSENAAIYAAIGTVQLRNKEIQFAIEGLRTALKIDPALSKMRTNLGICLTLIGEDGEAESQFREALLHDPSLEIATLQLVELLYKRGDYENSLRMLERTLTNKSTTDLNVRAGQCASALGQIEKAKGYFDKAAIEEHPEALAWLAEYDIKNGRELLLEGRFIESLDVLSKAFHRAPNVFTGDTTALVLLNEISKIETIGFETSGSKTYNLLLNKFLKLGIIWEVFVREENLEQEASLWTDRIKKRGNYPYGQYRLGIIQAFQGKFMESLDSLDVCKALLPAKKQQILKLSEVMDAIAEVRDL